MKQEIVQLRKDVKVDGYSKNRVIFPGGPSWNKMREILPKTGWLLLLYLVCVLCQSSLFLGLIWLNKSRIIKLLETHIFCV